MPSNSIQLLKNYHDASQRIEAIRKDQCLSDEEKELYGQRTASARELISRCILSNDPSNFISLLKEIEIILKITGQSIAADYVGNIALKLTQDLKNFGAF